MHRQAPPTHRLLRGRRAYATGQDAETLAAAALTAEGWQILAQRCRTEAGEIDLIAEREGLLAFIEVKARPSLAEAAFALGPRQRAQPVVRWQGAGRGEEGNGSWRGPAALASS